MKPTLFRPLLPGFRSMFDDFMRPMGLGDHHEDYVTMPAVNIRETDRGFQLELAAPGLQKTDFRIAVEQGMLSIAAEQRAEAEDQRGRYTRREFRYTAFTRSFHLPEGVREEAITARYQDGILTLELPRDNQPEPEKGRTIAIS